VGTRRVTVAGLPSPSAPTCRSARKATATACCGACDAEEPPRPPDHTRGPQLTDPAEFEPARERSRPTGSEGLRPGPAYTPAGYQPVSAGQKRRNAPPMTHAHAGPPAQVPFRTRTGEMPAAFPAPAGPGPLLTRNLDPRPPPSSPRQSPHGGATRHQPGMPGRGQRGALNLMALPLDWITCHHA
jgi:hypothetical protein